MKNKYLPIGTVVLLKTATKRLMITGYCSAKPEEPNKVYDYVGLLFPEGNLAGDEVALFNHEQIEKISHMGLVDEEFKVLEKNIKDALVEEENSNQPVLMPLDNSVGMADLPPFTPDNINSILSQIKNQGDALKPISEPTVFNEEVIKQPSFQLPSLGGNQTDTESGDKNEKSDDSIEDSQREDDSNVLEKVADGQPVLQLQPIFTDDTNMDDLSTSNGGFEGLSRL